MATQATPIREQPLGRTVSWSWFREFIRWELAPYPGRMNTVIRMTISATLVMLIIVTFRIPNGVLAGLFTILLARENLAATWRGGRAIVIAFIAASLYTLLGMMLFRGYPITHFFWVIGSLYLIFFVIRTAKNYAAAAAFAIPIGVTLPVWDRATPSQLQVEGTLWPILAVAVATGVTVGIEAIYRIFDNSDPLIATVDDRLLIVQQVAESIARLRAPSKSLVDRIAQYQMTGTGRLRVMLQRQGVDPAQRARRTALISLAGRLITLAAELERSPLQPNDDDVIRLQALADRLGAIRATLRESGTIAASLPVLEGRPSSRFPILQEMEQTVALLSETLGRDEIVGSSKNEPAGDWWRAPFLPDAFQNPEYKRFAVAGCVAASLCYMLYNALDWPGISTSVLTCVVTALSTVGNSLQAQFLRLAGFVAGGLILGISAQILILPAIDSIFGFALFFAAATGVAAWFATSSPRLSFFGVQMALAFYFVNLQDFQIVTDLTIARDKALGVLLAILAMGIIFDRFGTKSDAEQLQKLLVRNVRMLSQLGTCSGSGAKGGVASQISRLRSEINENFASLESQTDAVRFEFEFRRRRKEEVAEGERIRKAQPALHSIYLLELSLLSHREREEISAKFTQDQNRTLDQFLIKYSDELMHVAAWIGHEEDRPGPINDDSIQPLQQTFGNRNSLNSLAIVDICQKMISSLFILRSEC
jgi:multidrug resistance protein MdtO